MKIFLLLLAAAGAAPAAAEEKIMWDYATSAERRCFCMQMNENTWPVPYYLARLKPLPKDCGGVEMSSATLAGNNRVGSGLLPCDQLMGCRPELEAAAAKRQGFIGRLKAADARLAACCPAGVCDEGCAAAARQEKGGIKLDVAAYEAGLQKSGCFGGKTPEKPKPEAKPKGGAVKPLQPDRK